jgi:multiple sugar transport system substrate-binding protein
MSRSGATGTGRHGARRRAALLGAGGAAGALLAACSAPAPGEPSRRADQTPVKLQFSYYADPEQVKLFEDIAAVLPAAEPRITVETVNYQPAYMEKVGALLAAGTAPDVMIMTDKELPAQAVQGAFLDLGPLLRKTRVVPAQEFFAPEWGKYVVDGVVRGLPVLSTQGVLWYHEGVLRRQGVAPPPASWSDPKWSWPAFLQLTQALTGGQGGERTFGYDGQQNWWYAQPWVWSNGGDILNADNTAAVLDRPEAQEGFQWNVDLVQRHRVMPTSADLTELGGRRPAFYAGRLAMVLDVTAFATVLDAYPDVPWNVAAMPRGKAGAITRSPGVGVTVWSQTRHQDEAWRLMETVSGPAGARLVARAHRGVPGLKKVAFSEDWVTPGSRVHWRLFPESLEGHTRAEQVTIKFPEMDKLLQQEWAKTLDGKQSVSQMAGIVKPQIDALLQSAPRVRVGT